MDEKEKEAIIHEAQRTPGTAIAARMLMHTAVDIGRQVVRNNRDRRAIRRAVREKEVRAFEEWKKARG